jgi:calcineurin-like phosphoesterase family protein
MIFVLSDTHFGDKSALKKSERPFATVEEMDEKILDNINSVVKENDTLYHLGDYSRTDLEFATKVRSKIICKKVYLVAGNHDFANRCSEFDKLFVKVDNIIETQVIGKFCVMCHYPL